MGREIKRVPLDFEWPLNSVWAGYLNPYYTAKPCPHCDGTGYSPEAKYLRDQWYGYVSFDPQETGSRPFSPEDPFIQEFTKRNGCLNLTVNQRVLFYGVLSDEDVLIAEGQRLCERWNASWCHHLEQADVEALWQAGRLWDFNPNWRENRNKNIPAPTAEEVNRRSIQSFGHDGINQAVCLEAKCKRLGYKTTCDYCAGEGEVWENKNQKALYEEWKPTDPPIGDGYQVWETVTEGSPISPVFLTPEEVVDWLVEEGYSVKAAQAFVDREWAPSGVSINGEFYDGVEGLAFL